MLEVRNYIRGEWLTLREGREIEVRNPGNLDEILAAGYLATSAHAEAAIAAASSALADWARGCDVFRVGKGVLCI